jgi:hypothetical protein
MTRPVEGSVPVSLHMPATRPDPDGWLVICRCGWQRVVTSDPDGPPANVRTAWQAGDRHLAVANRQTGDTRP